MQDVEANNKILYDDLFRKINGPSGRWEKDFKALFENEHPTLQQGFMRHCIIPALEVLAAQRADMRSQDSHDFAVEALKLPHYMRSI